MAATNNNQAPVLSADFPITIKVALDGNNRRFKLPLRDLGAVTFVSKVSKILQIPDGKKLTLERYSDSSSAFVVLDPNVPTTYKQLYRAAKAKQKLRFRAFVAADDSTSLLGKVDLASGTTQSTEMSEPFALKASLGPAPEAPSAPRAPLSLQSQLPSASLDMHKRSLQRLRSLEQAAQAANAAATLIPSLGSAYQVCCNNCDKVMPDSHFHCSICDNGDFDLCEACVQAGAVCPGEGHWLLKRSVKGGKIFNSTTERLPPKARSVPTASHAPMPSGSAPAAALTPGIATEEAKRTCNACVRVLAERFMITCTDCDDYDICMSCHLDNKHGHHPGHMLKCVSSEAPISPYATALCSPGRNLRHNAICDCCDKAIYGVRHKCLDCPDFDYCSKCVLTGRQSHRHRFVKVYEPLESPSGPSERHIGVYCDGHLCNGSGRQKAYIDGVRYKCAVCPDFDLCAACEAHPANSHNKSHPLIKFKTMVRDVSVETHALNPSSRKTSTLGDARVTPRSPMPLQRQASALNSQPHPQLQTQQSTTVESSEVASSELNAHFLSDLTTDGSLVIAQREFLQKWTMVNPGPHAWPSGCSVRLVGGDHMLNIDETRPVSTAELSIARESDRTLAPVLPGQTAQFSVTLKAPARRGRHISYWRLKSPDGVLFGHKLWCDVEVMELDSHCSEFSLKDMQRQLMLLDTQNKARLRMAHQEQGLDSPHIAEPAKDEAQAGQRSLSAMVFPKLEKESPSGSPAASAHEVANSITVAAATQPSVKPPGSEPTTGRDESEKDVESVVASVDFSDSDEDDGFYTDEEYDILDASDEEFQNNVTPAA